MNTPTWFLKRALISYLLWPVSLLYYIGQFIVSKSRLFYANCSKNPVNQKSKIPVICIGNILAGGVGKTPIVREVAKFWPGAAVVMRGYKGKKTGKVEKNDTAAMVGDEAKMLAISGIPVFVGKGREKSIKMAEKAGFSAVVMDDGFQNPTVKKDLSILVFDGKIGFGNGFMLPAGPLREPKSGINRADAVMIIGKDINNIQSEILKTKPGLPVFFAKSESVDPGITGKIVAFAGIGYPQKFFDALRKLFGNRLLKTIPFPDHYQYNEIDVARLLDQSGWGANALVTTEKDWVRLPGKNKSKIQFIPLKTTIEPSFYKWLKTTLGKIK